MCFYPLRPCRLSGWLKISHKCAQTHTRTHAHTKQHGDNPKKEGVVKRMQKKMSKPTTDEGNKYLCRSPTLTERGSVLHANAQINDSTLILSGHQSVTKLYRPRQTLKPEFILK